jgi:hypothetical protein
VSFLGLPQTGVRRQRALFRPLPKPDHRFAGSLRTRSANPVRAVRQASGCLIASSAGKGVDSSSFPTTYNRLGL